MIQSFNSPVSRHSPELAGLDVARDAFGSCADACQFVIVNDARAVHGDVIDEAVLHQRDQMTRHAGAKQVRAHEQDACG